MWGRREPLSAAAEGVRLGPGPGRVWPPRKISPLPTRPTAKAEEKKGLFISIPRPRQVSKSKGQSYHDDIGLQPLLLRQSSPLPSPRSTERPDLLSEGHTGLVDGSLRRGQQGDERADEGWVTGRGQKMWGVAHWVVVPGGVLIMGVDAPHAMLNTRQPGHPGVGTGCYRGGQAPDWPFTQSSSA